VPLSYSPLVLIYPNPATSETTVKSITDENEDQQQISTLNAISDVKMTNLELFNDQGKLLKDYSGSIDEGKVLIEINNEFKGIYYVVATFSDGSKQTKRLLIEK
jgi:hypothetical protein